MKLILTRLALDCKLVDDFVSFWLTDTDSSVGGVEIDSNCWAETISAYE